MSNEDLLRKYVDILEYGNHLTTAESEIYSRVKNDPELAPIAKAIEETFPKEARYAVIKKYEEQLKEKDRNELDQIKEACQKTFGVNLDNIEFKKLSNGKDIIAFHDPRLNRKRIIDYSYAKSLVSEFSNIQNNNVDFQTEDYEKNATNIAKAEAGNNINREFNMIDIEKFKANYNELIKRIPADEQYKVAMINQLLNQSTNRNIKYINLENMVALDASGNIIEASLDSENKARVTGTADIQRNVSSIDNAGNVTYSNNATYTSVPSNNEPSEITPTEFEQKEEVVNPNEENKEEDFKRVIKEEMEKHNMNGSVDDVYEKVKDYSEDLTKLEADYENKTLNDSQYEFYNELCDSYVNTNTLENKKTMSLTYTPAETQNNQAGFTTVILIALVAIAIGLIVIILLNL